MGKSITLKALRAREEAQVPPRLGVRIVAVFVVLQLLLLAALLLAYPAAARHNEDALEIWHPATVEKIFHHQ